jgi:cell division protein FtsB
LIPEALELSMERMPESANSNLSRHIEPVQRLWVAAFAGRRKAATLAAAALALGVGYHVVFGANGLTVYMRKRAETRELKQQTVELQRENDELEEHVDRLRSDPDAIEHEAREDLHYAKPGEVIYTLQDNGGTMPGNSGTAPGK